MIGEGKADKDHRKPANSKAKTFFGAYLLTCSAAAAVAAVVVAAAAAAALPVGPCSKMSGRVQISK